MKKSFFLFVLFIFALSTCYLVIDRPVLRDTSYGSIRFGSRLQDVEKSLKEKAKASSGEYECDFVTFSKYPGIMFMVEKGVITRADVVSASIPNALDIKIGTSLSEVIRCCPPGLARGSQS